MHVVALLSTYNERRFIASCLEHLHGQGVQTYLIDNGSTDGTVEIAEGHLGRDLLEIERLPRDGVYRWQKILERKEQLARELDADWFLHVDADELRLPPPGAGTLADALGEVDRAGYNAVNFLEFTFIPTLESPDHDHAEFRRTLDTYYPFTSDYPNQIKAWKAVDGVDLTGSAGHKANFPGRRLYPESFPMKHYLFLSASHAIEKYVQRDYDPAEVDSGWHGWRAMMRTEDLRLPSASRLRRTRSDQDLDPRRPHKYHWIDGFWTDRKAVVWVFLPEVDADVDDADQEGVESRRQRFMELLDAVESPAAAVHALAEVGITASDLAVATGAHPRTTARWCASASPRIRKKVHRQRVRELMEVTRFIVADRTISFQEAVWLRDPSRAADLSSPLELVAEGRWNEVGRIYCEEFAAEGSATFAADPASA